MDSGFCVFRGLGCLNERPYLVKILEVMSLSITVCTQKHLNFSYIYFKVRGKQYLFLQLNEKSCLEEYNTRN